jgi:hypothetical protein
VLILAFVFLLAATAQPQAAAPTSKKDASKVSGVASTMFTLAAEKNRFAAYQSDFLDFARPVTGTNEFDYAQTLSTVAAETADQVDAVFVLLRIYDSMSCESDKAVVSSAIREQSATYGKFIGISIKTTNLALGVTKRPGVVAEATRMRDDLREIQSIFDSIPLP